LTPTHLLVHYIIQIADHTGTQKVRKEMHTSSYFLPFSKQVHYMSASCSVSGAKFCESPHAGALWGQNQVLGWAGICSNFSWNYKCKHLWKAQVSVWFGASLQLHMHPQVYQSYAIICSWKTVQMCCVAASMNPAQIRNVWLGVWERHCNPEVYMIFMHIIYQIITVVTV